MTKTIRKVLVGAALTGFVMGASVAASASPNPADKPRILFNYLSQTEDWIEMRACVLREPR